MKLKNKKTGEIVDYNPTLERWNGPSKEIKHYDSLAELNAEWEDAPEEPKEYWFINSIGKVEKAPSDWLCNERDCRQEIGNRFKTEEEAKKAVEKLKAWKRLKDKGFRFEGWDNTDRSMIHYFSLFVAIEDLEDINKDLDLLFGGQDA